MCFCNNILYQLVRSVKFRLYATIAVYNLSTILKSLQIIDWNLIFCILSIAIAIYYSTSQIQISGESLTVFKKNGELIQFKNEQELSEQNKYLISSIKTQYDTFISLLLLIICSLGFLISYLLPDDYHSIQEVRFYIFLALFVISIAFKYRGNLKALCRRQENEITG